MAPFPEDEIMTIKRLEVALKKSDFKLLKDGAYKLHEKYHSHHHFQYLDLLKIILDDVEANYAIPPEIKDILVPTIKDILSGDQNYYSDDTQNRISSLTSLSYGTNSYPEKESGFEELNPIGSANIDLQEKNEPQEYIKPFQEFNSEKPIDMITDIPKSEPLDTQQNLYGNAEVNIEQYNINPTEDFITEVPVMEQQNIFESINKEQSEEIVLDEHLNIIEKEPEEEIEAPKETVWDSYKEEVPAQPVEQTLIQPTEQFSQNIAQENFDYVKEEPVEEAVEEPVEELGEETEVKEETAQEVVEEPKEEFGENFKEETEEPKEEPIEEAVEEPEEEQKSIAIFFGQDSSVEKIKNIAHYRDLINGKNDFSLYEITNLINEIKTQSDTNVSELTTLLEQLRTTNHNINLVTSSQSANLSELFEESNITYSIFNPS